LIGANQNITTGSWNIVIGQSPTKTSATGSSQVDIGDAVLGIVGEGLQLARYTVATLPTCNSAAEGLLVYVTDSVASPAYNGTLSGGGSLPAPSFLQRVELDESLSMLAARKRSA
jgi:hypothetical protein